MTTVITSICNSLMKVSIANTLHGTGNFAVLATGNGEGEWIGDCAKIPADIVLLEAAYQQGFTLEERLRDGRLLKQTAPECKVLLICDENSAPEMARKVAQAKKDGVIDDFVYSSVGESYLTAMLNAI